MTTYTVYKRINHIMLISPFICPFLFLNHILLICPFICPFFLSQCSFCGQIFNPLSIWSFLLMVTTGGMVSFAHFLLYFLTEGVHILHNDCLWWVNYNRDIKSPMWPRSHRSRSDILQICLWACNLTLSCYIEGVPFLISCTSTTAESRAKIWYQ